LLLSDASLLSQQDASGELLFYLFLVDAQAVTEAGLVVADVLLHNLRVYKCALSDSLAYLYKLGFLALARDQLLALVRMLGSLGHRDNVYIFLGQVDVILVDHLLVVGTHYDLVEDSLHLLGSLSFIFTALFFFPMGLSRPALEWTKLVFLACVLAQPSSLDLGTQIDRLNVAVCKDVHGLGHFTLVDDNFPGLDFPDFNV